MRTQRRRLLAASIGLALVLSACAGIFGEAAVDDCGLKPVGESGASVRIGPQVVAASCIARVEVNGRLYDVGVGRWLDEEGLELHEYAPITRASEAVIEPVAYALDGVDPEAFLVMRGGGADDLGPMGPFMALWGAPGPSLPAAVCQYADETDPQYPTECGR